jgi:hypothetical protein
MYLTLFISTALPIAPYVLFAFFYAVFGVSQATAIAAEFVCYAALAVGSYRLARFWLGSLPAFGAALILIAAPEIAYWGRQVMLEIPSFALLVWSAVFFMRYQREERIAWLYVSAILAVLAAYTKLTAIFILLVYFLALLHSRRAGLLRDKHSYIIALLTVAGLVPLAVLTLKFGQANLQSVSGISDAEVSRATLAGWLWYAKQMPAQMGWPALLAAVLGLASLALSPSRVREHLLLILWLAVGYLFFSAIDLKEARHSLFLLLPLAILAGAGLTFILRQRPMLAGGLLVALGFVTLGWTMFFRPVQYVAGYRELSDYIAQIAPSNGVVVFSGYRDGSFIFAMRTHEKRRDIWIVRSDKLLLRVAVRRSLGVEQKLMTEAEIESMLDQLGVKYIAAQPGFWTDLEAMKRFDNVLNSGHFQRLRRFAMPANYHAQESEIVVYKNLDAISERPKQLNIELPMIGKKISGTLGQRPQSNSTTLYGPDAISGDIEISASDGRRYPSSSQGGRPRYPARMSASWRIRWWRCGRKARGIVMPRQCVRRDMKHRSASGRDCPSPRCGPWPTSPSAHNRQNRHGRCAARPPHFRRSHRSCWARSAPSPPLCRRSARRPRRHGWRAHGRSRPPGSISAATWECGRTRRFLRVLSLMAQAISAIAGARIFWRSPSWKACIWSMMYFSGRPEMLADSG